jgi:hypothetical protein
MKEKRMEIVDESIAKHKKKYVYNKRRNELIGFLKWREDLYSDEGHWYFQPNWDNPLSEHTGVCLKEIAEELIRLNKEYIKKYFKRK